MTLDQQIKLIDELIRENPDVTIKEYWQAIGRHHERNLTLLIFDSAMNKVVKENRKIVNGKYLRTYRLHL